MQGTAKGLEMTAKGRQMVMATTAELSGRVVQKETVRKMGAGARHRAHIVIDDMVEVFESLPTSWRIVWVSGALILLVAGFTVLIVIPGSFTLLIAVWTFLIVKLANVFSADAPEDESDDSKMFVNPMADVVVDDQMSDSSSPSSAKARLGDVEEEVIGFNATLAAE